MDLTDLVSLMKCFSERYINTSDEQAILDAAQNRDNLVSAYNAIVRLAEFLNEQ